MSLLSSTTYYTKCSQLITIHLQAVIMTIEKLIYSKQTSLLKLLRWRPTILKVELQMQEGIKMSNIKIIIVQADKTHKKNAWNSNAKRDS